jgi:hypothetical protein
VKEEYSPILVSGVRELYLDLRAGGQSNSIWAEANVADTAAPRMNLMETIVC